MGLRSLARRGGPDPGPERVGLAAWRAERPTSRERHHLLISSIYNKELQLGIAVVCLER